MTPFARCPNIIVDGDEFVSGFLGLDWFPSKQASADRADYEKSVIDSLNRLLGRMAGWAVIVEIFNLPRKMYIRPYHPTPKTGVYNATAGATDLAAATLKDTTALDGQGNLPKPGEARVIGTGTGSDTVLRFSPKTWTAGAPTGPGASGDEILLHEMVHGMRQMAGRSVREAVAVSPGMDNYEEFVAITVSNIFRSECGIPFLRADHRGFAPLTGKWTNVGDFKKDFNNFLCDMDIEQPRFCSHLRRVSGAAFNPLI